MNLYLPDADKIYFSQTKTYFEEIVRAYDVGNYRSAMVMLYSTIVCDLLMKLRELSEVYSDRKAEKILKEIESSRASHEMRSSWEWQLIDRLHKETQMIDDETYIMIKHIYDLRNFSAHPALNEDYELVSPSPEMVVAHIKQALKKLFVVPSLFARSVVEKMSDDISSKRDMFSGDFDRFNAFLNKVYFSRMSPKMFNQVFRAFWKFAYQKTEGDLYIENRVLNRNVLRAMALFDLEGVCNCISSDQAYFTVAQEINCLVQAHSLMARVPQVYTCLSEEVKYQISQHDDPSLEVVRWFLAESIEDHLDRLKTDTTIKFRTAPMSLLYEICCAQGVKSKFLDMIIDRYAISGTYVKGREWFDSFVELYLEHFSASQFIKLIEAINSNPQLYEYVGQSNRNSIIVSAAKGILPDDFDYSKYEKFRFYQPIPEENGDEEVIVTDDMPF